MRMTTRSWLASALLALSLVGCSRGSAYPSRPILLVCPWAANGGSDRVARQVAVLLEQDLKVNVNVVNATGGEGVTGHGQGASAAPDGYTLTLMTVEINMLRWRGRTKLSYRDFEPVILMNRDPASVFVRRDAPWNTLGELASAVRNGPGSLRASGTALGGIWHLALAGWLGEVGLRPADVVWVASQGSSPALRDLLAGGVELVVCSMAEARTLLLAGEIRSLGVMGEARSPLFPDVPTLAEEGVPWTMGAWRGIGVPRGTPRKVRDVLEPALLRVVRSERFLEYMKTEGFGALALGPAEFAKSMAETDERMKALLTSEAFRSLSQARFSAMTFPWALLALLVATIAAALATGQLRQGLEAATVTAEGWRRCAEGLLMVGAYMFLSPVLGFVLTAIPIVFLALWRLGNRPRAAAVTACLAVLFAYTMFGKLLRVPFPQGPLGW
jgi:tripartite-type tricarboxylate transporter receptor subunit TctC